MSSVSTVAEVPEDPRKLVHIPFHALLSIWFGPLAFLVFLEIYCHIQLFWKRDCMLRLFPRPSLQVVNKALDGDVEDRRE